MCDCSYFGHAATILSLLAGGGVSTFEVIMTYHHRRALAIRALTRLVIVCCYFADHFAVAGCLEIRRARLIGDQRSHERDTQDSMTSGSREEV